MKFKTFAAAAVMIASIVPAHAAEKFVSIEELVPIMAQPGQKYVIEEGGIWGDAELGDGYAWPEGVSVYGDIVEIERIEGEHAERWGAILDPESKKTLGYVEWDRVAPMPQHEKIEPTEYMVCVDSPKRLLLPGEDTASADLARYGAVLLKGEIVVACARANVNGEAWLMLRSSTSVDDVEEGSSSGLGMRYSWVREADVAPLSSIDFSGAPDEKLMPTSARGFDPSRAVVEYDARTRANTYGVSGETSRALAANGFELLAPYVASWIVVDDMADAYRSGATYMNDFVTVDLFMHAHHVVFARTMRTMESEALSRALSQALSAALDAHDKTKFPDQLAEAADIARDMLTAPLALLGADVPNGLSERALVQTELAQKASGVVESPITGEMEDFSQYAPRGWYAGDEALERYFRAVTCLGQCGVQLVRDGNTDARSAAAAALVIRALDAAGDAWTKGYLAPTNFLMGTPDDGDFAKWAPIVLKYVSRGLDKLDERALDEMTRELVREVGGPRIRDRKTGIVSREEELEMRGLEFRVCGKRFTFDAYVMNMLTSPRVDGERNLPEGTDVMAALGSPAARDVASKNFEDAKYKSNLETLIEDAPREIEGEPSMYGRTLSALRAYFDGEASAQFFRKSRAWGYKKLMTALASYAELKHDSVLYAKQNAAEAGGPDFYKAGSFAPPSPRGYVEPEPRVFAAIAASAGKLVECIEMLNFEGGASYASNVRRLESLCETARRIAQAEVDGARITPDDYAAIKEIARAFDSWLLMAPSEEYQMGGVMEQGDVQMAIVTDIANDYVKGRVLHVATGTPRPLNVFVCDASGGTRIARGWTYSYYEFPRATSDGRMTDQDWRSIVYDESRAGELDALLPEWHDKTGAKR